MDIKDLQPRQADVEVEAVVISVSEPREFNKSGKPGKVANAVIKDATGSVKLSLWNEQIERIKTGDRIKIEKGYVGEWQGELQLTTGKFGTIDILGQEKEEKREEQAKPEAQHAKEDKKPDSKEEGLDIEEEDMNF